MVFIAALTPPCLDDRHPPRALSARSCALTDCSRLTSALSDLPPSMPSKGEAKKRQNRRRNGIRDATRALMRAHAAIAEAQFSVAQIQQQQQLVTQPPLQPSMQPLMQPPMQPPMQPRLQPPARTRTCAQPGLFSPGVQSAATSAFLRVGAYTSSQGAGGSVNDDGVASSRDAAHRPFDRRSWSFLYHHRGLRRRFHIVVFQRDSPCGWLFVG